MLTDPILDAWLTAADGASERHPELKDWFEDRRTLVATTDRLTGYAYDPGDVLMTKDANERSALFLAMGTVEVMHTDEDGAETPIRQATAPTTLGAFGFAVGRRRTATVRAVDHAIALSLDRQTLAAVAEQSPRVAIGLLRWLALDLSAWLAQTRGRLDPWSREHGMAGPERRFSVLPPARYPLDEGSERKRAAGAGLSQLSCFQGADATSLIAGLGDWVNLVGVDPGAAVTSHGDRDRTLLVLIKGRASVRNEDGEVLAQFDGGSSLSADQLIGELSFLTGAPRSGTVIADSECTLLEIPHGALPWIVRVDHRLAFRLHVALLRTVCWRLHEVDMDRERTAQILAGDLDAWLNS